ncbi:putative generative cell specific-1/HAP2 domain-containing protein [Helianthus annuus]|nr:putative generative cell specific-1/HAP2 domain-containing protein [Helianthus annuus]
MAVPRSGKEASIVVRVDEVEEKSDDTIKTLRDLPVITVYKSAAYALHDLTYIRDVPYKPEEFHVKTRKCESHAGANIVGQCVSFRDDQGCVIEHTQVPLNCIRTYIVIVL